mmetsp:Transcript_15901/g.17792  ORF Transcript_15901/g.17792 Transcript_15901/m.17792 type:complete len:213 (-) Transcript_15901:337-975(-)
MIGHIPTVFPGDGVLVDDKTSHLQYWNTTTTTCTTDVGYHFEKTCWNGSTFSPFRLNRFRIRICITVFCHKNGTSNFTQSMIVCGPGSYRLFQILPFVSIKVFVLQRGVGVIIGIVGGSDPVGTVPPSRRGIGSQMTPVPDIVCVILTIQLMVRSHRLVDAPAGCVVGFLQLGLIDRQSCEQGRAIGLGHDNSVVVIMTINASSADLLAHAR